MPGSGHWHISGLSGGILFTAVKQYKNFFLFFIFLLIGLGLGAWLRVEAQQPLNGNQISASASIAADIPAEENKALPDAAPAGQSGNVLWITVDQLGSRNPRLLKIWLVIPQKRTQTLYMIPVYPNQGIPDLAETFGLQANQLNREFSNLLNTNQVSWTHFIVADLNLYRSISPLFQLTDGAPTAAESLSDGEATIDLWADPQASLIDQVALINQYCHGISQVQSGAKPNLSDILQRSAGTYLTNFSQTDFLVAQKYLEQENALIFCSFPTINQFNP